MTYNEIINIAKRLDEQTKKRIDKDVEERLEILKLGDLDEEQMQTMEECLYMSLVIQEYLDGEYELIDEERIFLLEEMEDLYGEYNDLLLKAKLEEKVSKKKRMALELMRIREQLFRYKDRMRNVNKDLNENRQNKEKLNNLSDKDSMKELAKENKKYNEQNKQEMGKEKGEEGKSGHDSDTVLENPKASSEGEKRKSEGEKEVKQKFTGEKGKEYYVYTFTTASLGRNPLQKFKEKHDNNVNNVRGDSGAGIQDDSPYVNEGINNGSRTT